MKANISYFATMALLGLALILVGVAFVQPARAERMPEANLQISNPGFTYKVVAKSAYSGTKFWTGDFEVSGYIAEFRSNREIRTGEFVNTNAPRNGTLGYRKLKVVEVIHSLPNVNGVHSHPETYLLVEPMN